VDAWCRQRVGRFDGSDPGVRMDAPNERDLQHPRQVDVIGVPTIAAEESLVLGTEQRLPDVATFEVRHDVPASSTTASFPASTMFR
jgi:hypothetical protein